MLIHWKETSVPEDSTKCKEIKLAHTEYIMELNLLKETLLNAGDTDGAKRLSNICYELGVLAGLRFQLEKLGNTVLTIDPRSQDAHVDGIGAVAHAVRLIENQHTELESLRMENIELRNCDEQ